MMIRSPLFAAQSILSLALFGFPQQGVQPAPSSTPQAPATTTSTTLQPAPQAQPAAPASESGITEDEIRHLLGKSLFLRGFYLSDELNYNEHGKLVSNSPVGSFTLSAIEVERVRLLKHKLELEGIRYALHYTGTLATEGGQNAYDRIRITPKKKVVHITLDREQVVVPKKKKNKAETKPAAAQQQQTITANQKPAEFAPPAAPAAAPPNEEEEAKKERPEEKAADPDSVTTTLSPAHSAMVMREALKRIFSDGIDDDLLASLPDFWKNYYLDAEQKRDFVPADPRVTRLGPGIRAPRLLTHIEADSNEYAQQNEISGLAQYHVVLSADGTVKEIAASRPIGFGLDENAAAAIRKARFEPATRDGLPVPVLIDITVPFRIYSQRTLGDRPKKESAAAPHP